MNNGLNQAIFWRTLHSAAANGRLSKVRKLIKAGANVNTRDTYGYTALMYAARLGHLQTAHELVRAGANVNARNDNGTTALMLAASGGHLQIVHELVRAGVNLNARNNDGDTALMWAARWGRLQIVRELLKAGAKNWKMVYNSTNRQAVRNVIKNHASKVITSGIRTATTRRRVAAIGTLMKKTPINRGLTTRIMSMLKG